LQDAGTKSGPMHFAETRPKDSAAMKFSAVPFVDLKAVRRIAPGKPAHQMVAGDFRRDGSKRNNGLGFIAADNGALFDEHFRRAQTAIEPYLTFLGNSVEFGEASRKCGVNSKDDAAAIDGSG